MIKYQPNLDSGLWSRKCIRTFETTDDLRNFVVKKVNRILLCIGKEIQYHPNDVELIDAGHDPIMGWKNYRSIILDGRLIGYCGE